MYIKEMVADFAEMTGASKAAFNHLSKKYHNNYVRVVNYHEVFHGEEQMFSEHLRYFQQTFENCDYQCFTSFVNGDIEFKNKPGLMLSFDDGYVGNYQIVADLLEAYGFTGYFMVSSGLVGKDKYMTWNQLADLQGRGHIIGCHTHTHHRMSSDDSEETLHKEIVMSKEILEDRLGCDINIFCWCFGDRGSYTHRAYETIIKAGYKYAFMTDLYPVLPHVNPMHIQRSNIQAYWNLNTVKFQLSGLMDIKYKNKRKIDEEICS